MSQKVAGEHMSRKYTNKLLDMIEQGLLDKDVVILAFSTYLSEADVQDMMESNGFLEQDEENTDEET